MKPDETPASNWANRALERALHGSNEERLAAQPIAAQRLLATVSGPVSYLAICTGGYWGRGATLEEAVKNSKAGRAEKVFGYVILNDAKPTVDGFGTACSSSASHQVSLGKIGTVGSVLNANK